MLLARNAPGQIKMFALITGFMEAVSRQEGIAREVKEETNLDVQVPPWWGLRVLRMNRSSLPTMSRGNRPGEAVP